MSELNKTLDLQAIPKKKERESGLEILRIVSIFLITCVHMLNYGLFLEHAVSKIELLLLRLLYSFFTVSVNVFVLISGYFLVKSKFRLMKIIKLWITVVFYSLVLYGVSIVFFEDKFTVKDLIECFFPFINDRYWFFTAYILMYLASPFLNKIINNTTNKERIILLVGVLVFSYLTRRFSVDAILGLRNGYSFLWFVCLYLIAGILRASQFQYKKRYVLLVYLACIVLIWGNFYYTPEMWGYQVFANTADYASPFVLIASVTIFLLFKELKFESTKINKGIRLISSTTFGIYLLQEARFFKPHLYFDILKIQRYYSRPTSVLYILFMVSIIFVFGLLFDLLRQLLFSCIEKIIARYKKK